MSKRIKETPPIDRLSALPDSLIIHILSLLEVKQSSITALLSKKWQFLWTQSPRLIFSENRFNIQPHQVQDFVNRVNRTLVICGRNDLDTFELQFPYKKCYSPDVHAWVGFALNNKAKQVSLLLTCPLTDSYKLPQTIFQSAYLKRLTLCRCVMAPLGTIEWSSLAELTIEDSKLEQHVMDKILMSGCPVLHSLVLRECWGFKRLEVTSKSVYELRVYDPLEYEDVVYEPLLQISAPYLHTLWVELYPIGRKLCLENTPSLVRATLEFLGSYVDDGEMISNAKELLEKIRHVKVVNLRMNFMEVLSWLAINDYRFPQSARTDLLVDVPLVNCSMHALVGLLKSSPNLEALVIEGFDFNGEPCPCIDSKTDTDFDFLHLKSIVIKDCMGLNVVGEQMLMLARILLNKAPALERIVVHSKIFTSSSQPDVNESFKIAQKLLSYPRSSKTVILLK